MSDLEKLMDVIIARLNLPDQAFWAGQRPYDVRQDSERWNGIVFIAEQTGGEVSITLSEIGDNYHIRYQDDGGEFLLPKQDLLGKPN